MIFPRFDRISWQSKTQLRLLGLYQSARRSIKTFAMVVSSTSTLMNTARCILMANFTAIWSSEIRWWRMIYSQPSIATTMTGPRLSKSLVSSQQRSVNWQAMILIMRSFPLQRFWRTTKSRTPLSVTFWIESSKWYRHQVSIFESTKLFKWVEPFLQLLGKRLKWQRSKICSARARLLRLLRLAS